MTELKPMIHDEKNGLDYILVGEIYLPLISLPREEREIGRWGRLRRNYLKEHRTGRYNYLLLTGKLDSHLADLDEQARELADCLEAQMREAEGVTEKLKAKDALEWVRRCNNIRARVDEMVMTELVYA